MAYAVYAQIYGKFSGIWIFLTRSERLQGRIPIYIASRPAVNRREEKVGGKYVHFDDINHTEGLLVAGVIDSIDGDVSADNICFAVVDRDRNVQYVNNNEHFSVLREVPNNLSVLDYLYTRESKCIYDRVVSQMKSEGVEMFTKNYIYVPKSKMGDVKTKKANKNNKKTTKKR